VPIASDPADRKGNRLGPPLLIQAARPPGPAVHASPDGGAAPSHRDLHPPEHTDDPATQFHVGGRQLKSLVMLVGNSQPDDALVAGEALDVLAMPGATMYMPGGDATGGKR
jgi:hypothetical protein